MIFGARSARGGLTGAAGGALIMVALFAAWIRQWAAMFVTLTLAWAVWRFTERMRPAPRLAVTALGVTWMHPERGNGAMTWREVGAITVREVRGGRDLAICLVPRDDAGEGRRQPAFILSTEDMDGPRAAAEAALAEFASAAVPRLARDAVADRTTRAWLAARGIEWPG